jgi:hypothetical protein
MKLMFCVNTPLYFMLGLFHVLSSYIFSKIRLGLLLENDVRPTGQAPNPNPNPESSILNFEPTYLQPLKIN